VAAAKLSSNFLMETYMKKLMAILALLTYGALVGCNTIEGAGKDIERGGEKLQDKAQDTKQRM
jgi:predicted small secreted protein